MSFSFDAFIESPPYDFWESEVYERIESGAPGPRGFYQNRTITAEHGKYGFGIAADINSSNFSAWGEIITPGKIFLGYSNTGSAYNVPRAMRAMTQYKWVRTCQPSFYALAEPISSWDIEESINPLGGHLNRSKDEQVAEPWRGLPSPTELESWTVVSTSFSFAGDQLTFTQQRNSGGLYATVYTFNVVVTYSVENTNEQVRSDFVALWDATPSLLSIDSGTGRTYYYDFDTGAVTFVPMPQLGGNQFFALNPDEETVDAVKSFMSDSAGDSVSSSPLHPIGQPQNSNFNRWFCCSYQYRVTGPGFSIYTRTSDADNNTTSLNQSYIPDQDGFYTISGTPLNFTQRKIGASGQAGFPSPA